MLKETLDWIETMAERRDINDKETKEVASILARRQKDEYTLPKTLARESLNEAMEVQEGRVP